MALSSNVVDYINRNREKLSHEQHYVANVDYQLRGYVSSSERISGEEADRRNIRMMNEW